MGAFRSIDQEQFAKLLRSLAGHELIQQMQGGDLILAPEGETIVNHYSFYSAFATPIEYSVVYGGQLIGTLPALYVPLPGDHFILGGRRWQVVEVDDERREIVVRPAHSSKPPRFLGAGGEIHSRVRQQMRAVLLGTKTYTFLNQTAASLLEDARSTAGRIRLAESPLVALGNGRCLWFTWTGTKVQRTLCLIAQTVGLDATDRDIAIEFEVSADDVRQRLGRALAASFDPFELATHIPAKQIRKFDGFVSDELLTYALAEDAIEVQGAEECMRALLTPST
jgi:ATP-dependent Lhr-like helicase